MATIDALTSGTYQPGNASLIRNTPHRRGALLSYASETVDRVDHLPPLAQAALTQATRPQATRAQATRAHATRARAARPTRCGVPRCTATAAIAWLWSCIQGTASARGDDEDEQGRGACTAGSIWRA